MRRCTITTVCSQHDAKLLSSAADGRGCVEVLPNGVDLDYFGADGPELDGGHIVLTGSMDWEPNADAAEWLCKEILPAVRQPGIASIPS